MIPTQEVRTVALPSGEPIPVLGQGTWHLAEGVHPPDVETDQVLYNLTRRGIEWNLLPACQRIGLPIMAYSPIEQGRLAGHSVLEDIGRRHGATPTQVALSWVTSHPGVCAIPEAGTPEHVRENVDALRVILREDDVVKLDAAFPRPAHPIPLEVL